MAARLKLCIMCHVEDSYAWQSSDGVRKKDPTAMGLGYLATVTGANIGANGAKVSVQFGRNYLDQLYPGAPYPGTTYPGGPTSLRWVLGNGGNFWNHTHSAGYANLVSNWWTVSSAYASESPLAPTIDVASSATAGRSGGADPDNPGIDWASISVAAGIKRINSNAANYYACTPESLRPYKMSATDIDDGVYYHDIAPGPLYEGAPTTMRQRPFWVNSASQWDFKTSSTNPQEATVGSLLMIPHPSRYPFRQIAEGRGPYTTSLDTITQADLDAAFTEVWSTYKQMELHQSNISNVWYLQINPNLLANQVTGAPYAVVDSLGSWVQSINALVNVPNSAVWMNMNEIASWYVEPQSAYY
ncbi:MAG: hypothetical protein FJ102_05650 [Deltaproteobacteria bacterium]|nr:hypothetical protein [Deltaproteobacteria bacterium]